MMPNFARYACTCTRNCRWRHISHQSALHVGCATGQAACGVMQPCSQLMASGSVWVHMNIAQILNGTGAHL